MNSYRFTFLASAFDYVQSEIQLTEFVKQIKFGEKWEGELVLSLDVEADSSSTAHKIMFQHIDDLYDQYYLLSKFAIPIRKSDEIHVENLTEKTWDISDHSGFSLVPFQLNRKQRTFLFNNSKRFRRPEFKFLNLALQYHRKSKLATSFEDKVIYQTIALESLYSKENSEITFRFSRRLANLLGSTTKQRKSLVEKTSSLYRLRSQIVHGNSVKIDEKLITTSEEWVRNSIFCFIALMQKFESRTNILTELDHSLVDEKTRTKLQKIAHKFLKQYL